MQIAGSTVPRSEPHVRANTNPSVVGSVYFTQQARSTVQAGECSTPMRLFGDK